MKNHFVTLFDPTHKKTTVILIIIALLLIAVSLIWGLTDNLPAIAMIFAGIIVFCFSIIHPWKNTTYYATLVAACGTILPLVWGSQTLGEFIDYFIGVICAAGILTGIIGIIIRLFVNASKRNG
jgi:uncharacterized membrane protein